MAISPSPFDRMQRRRAPSRLWVLWLLLIVLLAAALVFFREPASSLFWRIAAPVVRVRQAWGSSEASVLRAELASSTAALADRNALYRENIDLRARLGRADAGADTRVVAGVLQSPPWTAYDTLLIDAGAAEGLAVGDLVAASGQAYIGRVSEVYARQARVELFSAPGASYQAILNGTVPLAVEGQGGGSMHAEVPAGTQVSVGDTVEFPGLAGGIVAAVSATDAKMGESFIDLYLRLPVNPADLSRVEVVKNQ